MKIKPYLYIIFLLFIFIGCNNNVKESIKTEEETHKELIKDSSLIEEIRIFVDSLRANGVNEDFVLMVKFDSTKFSRTGDIVLGIWLDIYPCFSDTVSIWGGYLPNLDIPVVIKDEKGIGQTYYNPVILNDTIRQSYYCDESVVENQFITFYDSLIFNRESIVVGLMFFVDKETNKLFCDGITFVENIE